MILKPRKFPLKAWISLFLLLALLAGCTGNPTPATPCNSHADVDNNGLCDLCKESVLVYFEFYAINDLHGKFSDTSTNPGVDELTTYFKQTAASTDNVYFLSSGDMWQGSAESNMTYGTLMTDWMNELDFVSMTLGNHEFDWGTDYIQQNRELAEFPFLAINVFDRNTNERVSYCDSSVMVEADGIQIGIIGAVGDCYSSIMSSMVEDVYFATDDQLTKLVKEESQRLRAQGADFIIYSLHDGYDRSTTGTVSGSELSGYYDISLSDGYVDLVFEAHIHKNYAFQDSYGVYHLQGGGENDGITHARIQFNTANGSNQVVNAKYLPNSYYQDLEDDPLVENLLDKYQEQIDGIYTVLGQNDVNRSSNELRNLVAQLYYETGLQAWGEDYPITLGGGYLSVRSPYSLEAGDVTYAMLHSLMPFDNQIVLCSVKGDSLLKNFINSNNKNYFIAGNANNWNSIDPQAAYYIVVDTYTALYAPNRLTVVEEYDADTFARDLLAEYIRQGNLGVKAPDEQYTLTGIADILSIGNALKDNETTKDAYYVTGVVQEVHNTTYGNLTIKDENGQTLYIYGTYDKTGKIRYDALPDKPKVGDTIVLYGKIQKYVPKNGTPVIELIRARIIP